MTNAIKIEAKKAEEVKQYLMSTNNLSHTAKTQAKNGFVYFPIISKAKVAKKYTLVNIALPEKKEQEKDLKTKILSQLTKKEQEHLKTSFDHVGTIAILEIEPALKKKEKIIASALLEMFPSIKTVLKKAGSHEGTFRTQKMQLLAGIDTRETCHKESGTKLWLDVEQVYFSPRLSTERKRIFEQIKKGESILVMFSGCAPYPCVIAKNTQAKEIIGVELNPIGHQYGLKNVTANKLKNVTLYQGDVRTVVPKLNKIFDRILMPLPKSSEEFLDVALAVSKKGTIIHCYDFLHEDHFNDAVQKIENACKIAKKKCKILGIFKCGQHSPRTFRICVDFEIVN
ncbi:class I SAM-dependent methyltransferase family protein [Candidatus Woesearchaeota archaeon]|nr:class I SAM-dependent methyltransferase family protein [Candidatus Woesearchaeota archaeon]